MRVGRTYYTNLDRELSHQKEMKAQAQRMKKSRSPRGTKKVFGQKKKGGLKLEPIEPLRKAYN